MMIPSQRRKFIPSNRREDVSRTVFSGLDLATAGIDEAILAAGFRPIPFRRFLEPFTKRVPSFLLSQRGITSLIPIRAKPRQLSLPLLGNAETIEADHSADVQTFTEPIELLSGATNSKKAIKSPARLLATAQMLSRQSAEIPTRLPRPSRALALFSLVCLAGGILVDHFILSSADQRASLHAVDSLATYAPGRNAITPLNLVEEENLDAAYSAQKAGRFAAAKQLFFSLKATHPGWYSIDATVGTTEMFQQDWPAAQITFEALKNREVAYADANFRLGILFTVRKAYDQAERYFAAAVASDPSRPEFYFFWGECLHQEGKPREAVRRFRSALLRNEFVASDSFYRLKLWLCEVQADLEDHDGTGLQIDAAMAQSDPPVEALVATAARNIKAGDFKMAARRLLQASTLVDPTLYSVILHDPTFLQERWRPEMGQVFGSSTL